MSLLDFYPQIKHTHIGLATLSVSIFASRGMGVLAGAQWPMQRAARMASELVDTLLLAAGGTLWWLLSLRPDRDTWLLAKLLLILLYVVLGSLALKRAPTRGTRAIAFVAALVCIAAVATIALSHDALAPLRPFIGGGR